MDAEFLQVRVSELESENKILLQKINELRALNNRLQIEAEKDRERMIHISNLHHSEGVRSGQQRRQ